MATTVYFFTNRGSGALVSDIHLGTNNTRLDSSASGWVTMHIDDTRQTGATQQNETVGTVSGPTSGVECYQTDPIEWLSFPLDQDVTISGTVTFNLWGLESNMSANAAINCIIQRLDSTGAIISTIVQTARTVELGTSSAVANFTATPTSTNMKKGDRFRVRVYFDDAASDMVTGHTCTFSYASPNAAVDGDSWVQFTETFGLTSPVVPGGSILYLTATAGPAVGAAIEKEMWTGRGGGVTTAVVNTVAGWTAPVQWTDAGGGTVMEWYSRQLAAFTLSGLVALNIRMRESNAAAECGYRCEIAVCNGDGSNATVWGAASGLTDVPPPSPELSGVSENLRNWFIAGADIAVTAGQRLRLRMYIDDTRQFPMVTGHTATLYYAGTSGGASGDSFITLPQSVAEFSAGVTVPFNPIPFYTPKGKSL